MALVFISHAHRDEALARKVSVLLSQALGMNPSDFFLSSEAGHGVAPSAGIRTSITNELRGVPVLVVLLTPKAAASPWVWIESGERLAGVDKTPPIFVIPSARHVSLLAPVADLRCLQIDNEGELLELVRAVGAAVNRPVVDVLNYKVALDDAMECSAQTYSLSVERRGRAVAWLRAHAVGVVLAAVGLGAVAYSRVVATNAPPATSTAAPDVGVLLNYNQDIERNASRFLLLKGRVTSKSAAVQDASVMVSREQVTDPSKCTEPDCTKVSTTTEGQFTLELTKIRAADGDPVILSVSKPGFAFASRELDIDVRATDGGSSPQDVALVPAH
jgi:hypothetical protein